MCHMRRQMRNSSLVASIDPLFCIHVHTVTYLGELPHRRASRHLCNSSSSSSSSSAVKYSSDLFLSTSGLANFNLDHSSRSWSCVTSRSPLRYLGGLILRVCRLPERSQACLPGHFLTVTTTSSSLPIIEYPIDVFAVVFTT